MGLKNLLSKEGRKERGLLKAAKKAAEKKHKTDERRPALYMLLEDGQASSIAAVLKRFTFIYDTNIVVDEEEKDLVYEGLVKIGKEEPERLLEQLRSHLKSAPTLSWGLRLLRSVYDDETTWTVVEEVLQGYDPEYERDPTRKLQLMTFLGDIKDERAVAALAPFLEDHDETVRFTVIESLFSQGQETVREQLLAVMTNEDEESGRIKHRVAEGFVELGWQVKGFRGTVEKLLQTELTEFMVDGKGHIKRKKRR